MPDEEEEDECISSVSSEESNDNFVASDDDESSESDDDVSYDQPELESEDDGSNTNQYITPRKSRQCTIETNEKMSQMLDEEELSDEEVFGSENDTQDMSPSSKLDASSSKKKLRTTRHNSRRRRKKRRMHNSEEEWNDNIMIGGSKKRRRGRTNNLDSVFDFHSTSSEDEEKPLDVRRSKKRRRSKRKNRDGNYSDDESKRGYHQRISRGSLQNEFDLDSSDGEDSIEYEKNQSSNNQEESELVDSSDEDESSEESNNKVSHLMGSKDLYCCPLCYIEASRRQGNLGGNMDTDDSSVESSSSSDDGDRKIAADPCLLSDDPMTILTNVGLDVASTFCFETLGGVDKYVDIGVKDHMKTVHDIDPSALVSNELFQRFKIRNGDSLLQRWLRGRIGVKAVSSKLTEKGRLPRVVEHKDMLDYWRDGNSEPFLQLHRMVHKMHRQMMHSGELISSSFSETFPNRAKNLWNKLSNPYLRQHEEEEDSDESSDMDDDEDIEQEGFMPPPILPGDEESDVEKIVAALQERYNQSKNEEEEYDTDNSSSVENEDEDDTHRGAGQRTSSGTRITPISELDLRSNRWTIRATVTSKRDIRDWSNKNGEGTVFSIDLLDSSGDVKCAFFNKAVDEFYTFLEVGRTYLFSGGRVKVADTDWNTCNSQFEITFDHKSDIVLVDDDDDTSTVESEEEENNGVEESDSSEEAELDENESEEEQEGEKKTKPTSRQKDYSSDSDEDDSLQPSRVSPDRSEFGGDLIDTDDEQPALLQPRQLGYSPEKKKKRKRILDDSDDES